MRLPVRLAALLAQLVQDGDRLAARLVGVHGDVVVADAVGREQADHGAGRDPVSRR